MELVVLGSGCFAPPRRRGAAVRNPAGCAVRLGRDLLLFDLGFGNLRQLARAGLDYAAVTDLFLSHRHPDHCGDLAALLFALRYGAKPRGGRLRLWGPRGSRAFLRRLSSAYAPWLGPKGYRLEARELADGGSARGPGWEVAACAVPHPTPALAYRLHRGGASLVYSGDTGESPRLARFAAGCDLLLVECTVPEREATSGHLTPRQALALADSSGARRTLLTHLSPESELEAGRLAGRRRGVALARDLLKVSL